jgi:hypothetical protein
LLLRIPLPTENAEILDAAARHGGMPLEYPQKQELMKGARQSLASSPVQSLGRDVVVTDPMPDKVARLLGLNLHFQNDEAFDVLIVGGGPAGVAAGVYAGPKV